MLQDSFYTAYTKIGESHFLLVMDRFGESLEALQSALKLSAPLNNKFMYITATQHLGLLYYNLHEYQKSIRCSEIALPYFQEKKNVGQEAAVYLNLGKAWRGLGDFGKAEHEFQNVLRLAPKLAGTFNDRVKAACSELAELYFDIGRPDQAMIYARRAVEALKIESEEADEVYSDLARYYFASKDYVRSKQAYEKALTYSKTNWIVWSGLAGMAAVEKKFPLADSLYERTMSLAEERSDYTDGSAVTAFFQKTMPVFQEAAYFYHTVRDWEKSYSALERGRARYFSRLTILSEARRSSQNKWMDSLRSIEREIGNYFGSVQESSDPLKHYVLESQRDRLMERLQAESPSYYNARKSQITSITKLQNLLGNQYQIVEFAVMRDSVLAIIIQSNRVTGIVLPIGSNTLKNTIDRATQNSAVAELHALYRSIFRPLEFVLDPVKDLIIIPDGVLFRVPFESLVQNEASSLKAARFLVYDYAISYAISASALAERLAHESHARKNYLGFAMSEFDTLAPLPFTRDQVRSASSRFSNADKAFDASIDKGWFFDHASSYRMIELATHAFVSDQEPMRSKIAMYERTIEGDVKPSWLYAYEIYHLNLDADLVSLSACKTGLGKFTDGEGFMGFNHAFSYAGANSLLLTMGNIDDEATKQIMDVFYSDIAKGLSKSQALAQAKRQYLQVAYDLKRSPLYWSGLTLWGNPRPISLTSNADVLILSTVVLILVLIGFRISRSKT